MVFSVMKLYDSNVSRVLVTFNNFGRVTLVIFLTLNKLILSVTSTNFRQITIVIFTTLSKSWISSLSIISFRRNYNNYILRFVEKR